MQIHTINCNLGVDCVISFINSRAVALGEYIIKTGATVRTTAKVFGISKSTVHKDVTERLEEIDYNLFLKVRNVLEKNKEERHIRGGEATKQKYKSKK